MSEAEQVNSAEARTETGELKPNLSTPAPEPTKTQETTTPSTTESKSEETKSSTTEGKTEEKPKTLLNQEEPKAGEGKVPETYEAFKVPEGFEIDETTGKEINGLFKGMNLTQENAQKLVDMYAQKMIDAQKAPFDYWENVNKKWVDEIKSDPEIGGKLPEVKATIAKALDGLGSPQLTQAFKDAMELTGAGNNPAFIRAFYKLSKQVTEGGHVSGAGPSKFGQQDPTKVERPTAASAIYPNLPRAGA